MSLRTTIKNISLTVPRFLGQSTASFLIKTGYLIRGSKMYKSPEGKKMEGGYYNRYKLYDYIAAQENLQHADILFLEFGVFQGDSILHWLKLNHNPQSAFWGFDTFVGLPEDWGNDKKGCYTNHGELPYTEDKRCGFKKGLFSETLPYFDIKPYVGKRKIIHLDADLYSSTLFVLSELRYEIKKGDLIILDDYFSPAKMDHEYKALEDFVKAYPTKFETIAKTNSQIVLKVL